MKQDHRKQNHWKQNHQKQNHQKHQKDQDQKHIGKELCQHYLILFIFHPWMDDPMVILSY